MLGVQVANATETVTYYYSDSLGTVLATANASGAPTSTSDYRPYGAQTLGSPSDGPGYAGHVDDVDSSLVYMQARYYDTGSGRFLSVDPDMPAAGNTFNFNRFSYVNDSPVQNVDPDGREVGIAFSQMNKGVEYPRGGTLTTAEKVITGGAVVALLPVVALAAPATPEVVAAAAPEVAGAGAEGAAPVAIAAANEASVAAQAAGATGGATSGLVTEAGEVFTGASTNALGPGMATNDVVQGALDELTTTSEYSGCCGEIDAMSKALNAGAKIKNATVATVRATGKSAGKLMKACASCRQVADKLGVKIVSPP